MKNFCFCFLILSVLTCGNLVAQTSWPDVVYLKNGTMYRGTLVEQHPDSLVRIEIAGGSIIAIAQEDLDHIEYDTRYQPKVAIPRSTRNMEHSKEYGYYNITEIGVLVGSNNGYYSSTTAAGFTIQTINGYRFNSHFLAGGGLGLDIIQIPMVQFFADGRWEILRKRATPFVYLDAGYGFPIAQEPDQYGQQIDYKGGFTWGSGVGMRFNFRNEGSFLISVGYKMDKRSEHIVSEWVPYDTKNQYTYNRLGIKFGLGF